MKNVDAGSIMINIIMMAAVPNVMMTKIIKKMILMTTQIISTTTQKHAATNLKTSKRPHPPPPFPSRPSQDAIAFAGNKQNISKGVLAPSHASKDDIACALWTDLRRLMTGALLCLIEWRHALCGIKYACREMLMMMMMMTMKKKKKQESTRY